MISILYQQSENNFVNFQENLEHTQKKYGKRRKSAQLRKRNKPAK